MGPGSTPSPRLDLTQALGEESHANYMLYPKHVRAAIEAHPLVSQHGMQPHVAMGLLQQSNSLDGLVASHGEAMRQAAAQAQMYS